MLQSKRVEVLNGSLEVHNATTKNGRPLSELDAIAKTLDRARQKRVPFNTEQCPYHDSRQGLQMNKSALEDIASRWHPLLTNLAYLRHEYFEGTPPDYLTARQGHDLAYLAQVLPAYFFNRAVQPFGRFGQLPDEVGDVHKVAKGLVSPPAFIVTDQGDETLLTDPNAMYQIIEDQQRFKGSKNRVCAAPPEMIINAGRALFFNTERPIENATLAPMIPDFGSLKHFADYSARFLDLVNRYKQTFDDAKRVLTKYPRNADAKAQFITYRDMYIAEAAPLQAEMNIALGHSPKLEVRPSPFDLERNLGLR